MGDGLCQTVAGAAWYHSERQLLQSSLPIGPLEESVHHFEDDPVATDHQQATPLIDIPRAHELAGVIRALGNMELVRFLRFRQDRMDPSLKGFPAPAGSRLRIQQHQQLPILARAR